MPQPDAPAVVFDWPIGQPTGWGQYGLHLALAMHATGCATPVLEHAPIVDGHSEATATLLRSFPRTVTNRAGMVRAVSLGRNVRPAQTPEDVALLVFEDTRWDAASLDMLRTYRRVIVGSEWNRAILAAWGFHEAVVGLQGYDGAVFRPKPRVRPASDGRILVFSGGKLEFRKGQDIVLEAFKRFRTTHPTAVLVTNWWNAWPTTTRGMSTMGYVSEYTPDQTLTTWAMANGVGSGAFLDCGVVRPSHVADVMRECDAAIFPNRAEGAINMVACETIGCGIPTAVSDATGHRDLLVELGPCAMREGRMVDVPAGAVPGYRGMTGWRETDPDDVVEALEFLLERPRTDTVPPPSEWLTWQERAPVLTRLLRS